MNPKAITKKYHVIGALSPQQVFELKPLGFATVICNRPDEEAEADNHSSMVQNECAAHGINFVYNPITMTSFSPAAVRFQTEAVLNTRGGVLAYCATGRRSAMFWALEFAHKITPDDLIAQAKQANVDLSGMREQPNRIYQSGHHY